MPDAISSVSITRLRNQPTSHAVGGPMTARSTTASIAVLINSAVKTMAIVNTMTAQSCGEILELLGLIRRANALAGSLTLLERKRLEMARALATAPKLLLLDEIAGGLTEGECLELVATIREIRQTGVAILWIEHVVHALLAVIDRLVVLNFGRKIAEGAPREVMQLPEVHQIYIGIEA